MRTADTSLLSPGRGPGQHTRGALFAVPTGTCSVAVVNGARGEEDDKHGPKGDQESSHDRGLESQRGNAKPCNYGLGRAQSLHD